MEGYNDTRQYIENTKETFKKLLPVFKKALEREAKCQIGDQKAYSLIAVARGYKDFNTALGSNAHNLYSLDKFRDGLRAFFVLKR